MTKVLIISQDSKTRQTLEKTLHFYGFTVNSVSKMSEAWKGITEISFDIVLVESAYHEDRGVEYAEFFREQGLAIPILLLGYDSEYRKIERCDFIMKPFKLSELRDKMNSLLEKRPQVDKVMSFGSLRIDLAQQLVRVKNRVTTLGNREMSILVMLAKTAGELVTREKIQSIIEQDQKLYYQVRHLRKKLQRICGDTLKISSVHGKGYRLDFN